MPNGKLIIGLTGGIASGKSEVSRRFQALGIDVIDADLYARIVVEPGTPALAAIAEHFGTDYLQTNGELDRAKLRARIFSDPEAKHWLEELLHPLVNRLIRTALTQAKPPYTILSSPLLLETSQHQLVDRILVVDTSESHQLERASLRDKSNQEQITRIMAAQLSRADRCNRANDIIQNHGSLTELDKQINKLHQLYLELAQDASVQP